MPLLIHSRHIVECTNSIGTKEQNRVDQSIYLRFTILSKVVLAFSGIGLSKILQFQILFWKKHHLCLATHFVDVLDDVTFPASCSQRSLRDVQYTSRAPLSVMELGVRYSVVCKLFWKRKVGLLRPPSGGIKRRRVDSPYSLGTGRDSVDVPKVFRQSVVREFQ